MPAINAAQELFAAFFAVYFSLTLDRSHKEYNAYDTYSAWHGDRRAFRRLVTAWTFLVLLPITQFSILVILLNRLNLTFAMTPREVVVLSIISVLAFFEWGYYRIYEGVLYLRPGTFYSEEEQIKLLKSERWEFPSHFYPGLFYIIMSFVGTAIIYILGG